MKVLIVEDEVDTLQLLSVYFETRGNEVTTARDGVEALQKFRLDTPEIVLLDVRLPRRDGWSVLTEIRAEGKVPVIMLTALDSAEDVVKGLTLGADDYLRKPFQLSELEARTRAVLRRVQRIGRVDLLRAGPCEIDDRTKAVTIGGQAVSLSPKEYELFKLPHDFFLFRGENEDVSWREDIRPLPRSVAMGLRKCLFGGVELHPKKKSWNCSRFFESFNSSSFSERFKLCLLGKLLVAPQVLLQRRIQLLLGASKN